MAWILLQQRREIFSRVIAHGPGTGHHEFSLRKNFAARVADQKAVGELADEKAARPKNHQ
jgi:hypothetical protein